MKKFLILTTMAMMALSCAPKSASEAPAIDLMSLDRTVDPADDFYRFATGGWQEKNPLKPEFARYGSFDKLRENNEVRINELFQEMTAMQTEEGSVQRKICDLYKLGLDADRLNAEGAAPLQEDLREIYSVEREGLTSLLATLHGSVGSPLFAAFSEADMKNSSMTALYLWQSGLGMGDRDYYLEEANAPLKAGYKTYLEQLFVLSGLDAERAKGAAAAALNI